MQVYAQDLIRILLIALRIAPTLAFAPPFTLLRAPLLIRLLLSLTLAGGIAGPASSAIALAQGGFVSALLSELLLGTTLALSLQLAFAAIQAAGRAIDFQAGFGLATLADPTLRTQTPLMGAVFGYAAGAVFFTTTGPTDLVALWSRSIDLIPIGAFTVGTTLGTLLTYISTIFLMSMGLAGIVLLTLFVLDVAIAAMSRTLPQMNVLVLGFQAKVLAVLVTLPIALAISGSAFLRILRLAIDTALRLP